MSEQPPISASATRGIACRLSQSLIAGLSSFVFLAGIFVATMLPHFARMDWPYLLQLFAPIAVISTVTGLLFLLFKPLRWYWSAPLGAGVGLVCALTYLWMAAQGR